MARRPTPQTPRSAVLTPEQMLAGIKKLKRRITELEAVDFSKITQHHHPELDAIATDITATLSDLFGPDTVEYERYSGAASFDTGPVTISFVGRGSSELPPAEAQRHAKNSVQSSIATLKSAVKNLEERLEDQPLATEVAVTEQHPRTAPTRRVFVVHGHDHGPKEAVARFLEKLGFEPVILHEQANQGRTIIEKFEAYADVGFAVVILTPDDEYGDGFRARQNVILELGYFAGALGRARVCVLQKDEVEWPSDVVGVGFTPYERGGAWKAELAKELKAAGYEVNFNSAMI